MVGNGGSSAGSYLTDPTSSIPSHCASIVATSTLRINIFSMTYTLYLHDEWNIKEVKLIRKALKTSDSNEHFQRNSHIVCMMDDGESQGVE